MIFDRGMQAMEGRDYARAQYAFEDLLGEDRGLFQVADKGRVEQAKRVLRKARGERLRREMRGAVEFEKPCPWRRARLTLMGQGRVGKVCAVAGLCGEPFDAAQRLPVRASPPLSNLTAARCSFCSSSAFILEFE